MIFITLQDALDELRPRINGGTCRDATAIARINQATRRIMNRPRKPIHVERVVRFFTRKDFITLPREVERIKRYDMDRISAPLFSPAYEFVSGGWGELDLGDGLPGKYLVDMGNQHPTMFDLPSLDWVEGDSNDEPEFSSFKLAAFSTEVADAALKLRIHGVNEKNESLGSPLPGIELAINRWHGGMEGEILMDLASAGAENIVLSEASVRDIERVTKPETSGFVSLYTYDEDTHQMYFLSKYHPQETNPRYRRYRITAPDFTNGSSIYALCELGFTPVSEMADVLLVQNLDALKMMVMAIELENERDFQAAKAYEADAYRLIDEQRGSERTHDYNLIHPSPCYGFGDIRAR